MKNILKIATLCLLLIACTEPQKVDAPPVVIEPVQNRVFQKSLPYIDSAGKTHQYTLSLPENYTEQDELPVVVYLHGDGGHENSELSSSHYIDNLLAQCDSQYPLIVYPSDINKLYILDNNYHIAFGLLEQIAQDYAIADAKKRVIIGFSNGASAASRTPIVNPGSYALSFSWSGWVWRKDTILFEAVGQSAPQLNALDYRAVYFTGDQDHPEAYATLIPYLKTHDINHELTVFDNQKHDLGQYHRRTQTQLRDELCQVFSSNSG